MNEPDTPRTDAAYKNHPCDMHDHIPLEFARTLERELAEQKDKHARSIIDWGKELAEACEQRNKAVSDYETAVLREHRMQEQRDRLAEALRPFSKMMGGHMYLNYELVENATKALAAVEGSLP